MKDASWPNSSPASSAKSQPQIRQRASPKIWPESSTSWSRKRAASKSVNRTPTTTPITTTTAAAATTTDRGSGPFTSSIECSARSWAAIPCHRNYLRPAKEEPPKWPRPCPTWRDLSGLSSKRDPYKNITLHFRHAHEIVSRDSPYKHTQKYSLYLMSISRTKKKKKNILIIIYFEFGSKWNLLWPLAIKRMDPLLVKGIIVLFL